VGGCSPADRQLADRRPDHCSSNSVQVVGERADVRYPVGHLPRLRPAPGPI